jgi:hypothetical protein
MGAYNEFTLAIIENSNVFDQVRTLISQAVAGRHQSPEKDAIDETGEKKGSF